MRRRDDIEIARRLLERDEEALRAVIRQHGSLVHGVAAKVIVEASLAEEVAQDTFLALWRRPGAFDPERGSLRSFLAGVARNKAIDLVRKEESVRRTRESLSRRERSAPLPPVISDQVAERSEMVTALSRLSEPQREALVLAYFGGRTYREVAVELEIPEGTAKTRLRDGLNRLRELMGAQTER